MDAWTVASGILLAGLIVVALWALVVGALSVVAWRSNRGDRDPRAASWKEEEWRARFAARAMARELRPRGR